MSDTLIARLYADFASILTLLEEQGEPSLQNTAQECFRKTLIMAAASYLESRLAQSVLVLVERASKGNSAVISLVQQKAIERQYHTWFDWEAGNANRFFSMFGQAFAAQMRAKVAADEDLATSIRAFLELGQTRNRLAHQNYGAFALEKTTEEIRSLYETAVQFVERLSDEFDGLVTAGTL